MNDNNTRIAEVLTPSGWFIKPFRLLSSGDIFALYEDESKKHPVIEHILVATSDAYINPEGIYRIECENLYENV